MCCFLTARKTHNEKDDDDDEEEKQKLYVTDMKWKAERDEGNDTKESHSKAKTTK